MSVMSVPSLGAHGEAASRPGRRVPLQVTLETTSRLVYPGDATYDAGCDGSPMAEVMGVVLLNVDENNPFAIRTVTEPVSVNLTALPT